MHVVLSPCPQSSQIRRKSITTNSPSNPAVSLPGHRRPQRNQPPPMNILWPSGRGGNRIASATATSVADRPPSCPSVFCDRQIDRGRPEIRGFSPWRRHPAPQDRYQRCKWKRRPVVPGSLLVSFAGDGHILCEAPEGPFRQTVPVTWRRAGTRQSNDYSPRVGHTGGMAGRWAGEASPRSAGPLQPHGRGGRKQLLDPHTGLMKTGTGTARNCDWDHATVQDIAEPVPVFISRHPTTDRTTHHVASLLPGHRRLFGAGRHAMPGGRAGNARSSRTTAEVAVGLRGDPKTRPEKDTRATPLGSLEPDILRCHRLPVLIHPAEADQGRVRGCPLPVCHTLKRMSSTSSSWTT